MSEINNRVFATPKRRLNRSSSNVSAGEPKPSPLSNFSFNISPPGNSGNNQSAFGVNPSVNTQQPQQQEPLFGSNTPTTPNFSFGTGGGGNTSTTASFGGNTVPSSKPSTTFGVVNNTAPLFGGGTSTAPSQSTTVTSPFGNIGGGTSLNITTTTTTKSPFGTVPNNITPTSTTIPTFGLNTNTSTSAPNFGIATTPTSTAGGGGFSFSFSSPTSKPPSFGNEQQQNKEEVKTNESNKEGDSKKENVPLFGVSKDDNKKDEKAPAFPFNTQTKKDDANTGIFGKTAAPLFSPLNTNHKREHSAEDSEPSTKKTMFTFNASNSTAGEKKEFTFGKKEDDKEKGTEKKKEDDKPTATTTATTEPKKVTFSFGPNKKDNEDKTTTTTSSTTTTTTPKEPSISLAFSTKKDSKDDSTTLSVSAATSISESVTPVIKSNITDPSQITKKTLFWELPEVAQKELATFSHFITSQADRLNQAALDTEFTIGSRVRGMETESSNLNNDAEILLKQLGYLNDKVNDLILKNNTHRVNITAAQLMQQQEVKHWRLRGAAENWSYFKDMVDVTKNRLDKYKESIDSIEETVLGLQNNTHFTPSKVGYVIESQGKMLLSLAGRIAEIHEQVERVVNQHKPNSRSSVF